MSTLGKGRFPLPEVARALSPYISTRQEALQIRRALTVYLTSLLQDEETAHGSSISLMLPEADIQLPEIPLEVSGVLKKYLKGMQAHLRAKREFSAVTAQGRDHPTSNSYIGTLIKEISIEDGSEATTMHTYLALLRQRRRYERLRILRDYMDVLVAKPAAKPGYLDIAKHQLDALPVEQSPVTIVPSGPSNESVDELVVRLEKAVLRAKLKLENEQKLFMRIKAEQQSGRGIDSTGRSTPSDRETRGHALHQTRQELINWVEGELAKTDVAPNTPQHGVGSSHESSPATRNTEQHVRDVEIHYGEYTRARKMCLATVAEATSSLPLSVSEGHPLPSSDLAERSATTSGACCSGLLDSCMRLLVPLNLQRLMAQQKAYVSSTLIKEQEDIIRALDRLADESHLLPAYPFLVTDSRFQDIAGALGSKISPRHLNARPGSGTQTKTLEMASRWAFAASAAKTSAQDALEEKIAQGTEHIGSAKEILSEVRDLLGQRPQLASTRKAAEIEGEDGDIWVSSTSARANKDNDKLRVKHKETAKNI